MKSPEEVMEGLTVEAEKSPYNFEELAELEPTFVSLVEKLKENIENGEYDALISDDAGGRIPTLVLRNIMQKIKPNAELKTAFVSAGKDLSMMYESNDSERHEEMIKYIEHTVGKPKKALVVTQFVFSGETLMILSEILETSGINDFDLATLDFDQFSKSEEFEKFLTDNPDHKFFAGGDDWHHLHERHEKFSGVRKRELNPKPFPERLVDAFEEQEMRFSKRSILPSERAKIQGDIVKAREDVAVLADRVVEKVWGSKNLE